MVRGGRYAFPPGPGVQIFRCQPRYGALMFCCVSLLCAVPSLGSTINNAPISLELELPSSCGRVRGEVFNGTLPFKFRGNCEVNTPMMQGRHIMNRFDYQVLEPEGELSVYYFQLKPDSVIFDFRCRGTGNIVFRELDYRTRMEIDGYDCPDFYLRDGSSSLAAQFIQPERGIGNFVRFQSVQDGADRVTMRLVFVNTPNEIRVTPVQFYRYQNSLSRIYCGLCVLEGPMGTLATANCVSGLVWDPVAGVWALAFGNQVRRFRDGMVGIHDVQRFDVPCMLVQQPKNEFGVLRS